MRHVPITPGWVQSWAGAGGRSRTKARIHEADGDRLDSRLLASSPRSTTTRRKSWMYDGTRPWAVFPSQATPVSIHTRGGQSLKYLAEKNNNHTPKKKAVACGWTVTQENGTQAPCCFFIFFFFFFFSWGSTSGGPPLHPPSRRACLRRNESVADVRDARLHGATHRKAVSSQKRTMLTWGKHVKLFRIWRVWGGGGL